VSLTLMMVDEWPAQTRAIPCSANTLQLPSSHGPPTEYLNDVLDISVRVQLMNVHREW
jgi:hypothetical protein